MAPKGTQLKKWMKNTGFNILLHRRNTPQQKWYKLPQSKRLDKVFHVKGHVKKDRVPTLIYNKIHFQPKLFKTDMEGHSILFKEKKIPRCYLRSEHLCLSNWADTFVKQRKKESKTILLKPKLHTEPHTFIGEILIPHSQQWQGDLDNN